MNEKKFIRALRYRLRSLSRGERQQSLAFYAEMIRDGMEEGLSEAQAVARLGSVEMIAGQLLQDRNGEGAAPGRGKIGPGWIIALAVMASPVWLSIGAVLLSLALAMAAVVLSVYACIWAALVSLYAADGALLICGPAGLLGMVMGLYKGNGSQALFFLAAGCAALGLGLVLLPALNGCCRGIARFTGRSAGAMVRFFKRRWL